MNLKRTELGHRSFKSERYLKTWNICGRYFEKNDSCDMRKLDSIF